MNTIGVSAAIATSFFPVAAAPAVPAPPPARLRHSRALTAARNRADSRAERCAAADQRSIPLLVSAADPAHMSGVDPVLASVQPEAVQGQPQYRAAF